MLVPSEGSLAEETVLDMVGTAVRVIVCERYILDCAPSHKANRSDNLPPVVDVSVPLDYHRGVGGIGMAAREKPEIAGTRNRVIED